MGDKAVVVELDRTKGVLAAEFGYYVHAMGAHVRELAAQARNVTVPDDFDLGDEVGKTGLDVPVANTIGKS